MSTNTEKEIKSNEKMEEVKNNEEIEEPRSSEHIYSKIESFPTNFLSKEQLSSTKKKDEETKIDIPPKEITSKKTPVKKTPPLKITDEKLLKKIEYANKISPLTYMTKGQKKKEMKMTEEEKEKNRKILYNMNLKLNFVKNPRYRHNIP